METLNLRDFEKDQVNYWSTRAEKLSDSRMVSIADPIQKDTEIRFIDSLALEFGDLLEIGCGNAIMTRYFEAKAKTVTAIDTSREMIQRAHRDNKFYASTKVQLGNATDLDFPDNSFDTIVLVRVLINMSERKIQEKAIREAHRVLKANGHMILIEGSLESFQTINFLRNQLELVAIKPSRINRYLENDFFENEVNLRFVNVIEINSGIYDFVSRVLFSGQDETQFNFKLEEIKLRLSRLLDFHQDFHLLRDCSRLRGGLYQKR
jgi:ubiquinone/menaquinone biosynthesis C-methylase UbiE